MSDINNNNLTDDKLIDSDIQLVISQTNYTKEEAIMHLKNNGYNVMDTITSYMTGYKTEYNKQVNNSPVAKSINQEIFSQYRQMLPIIRNNNTNTN
jgi:N-acetylmuramic acid 6-phosphate (MurNAc-6-P) etherase